MSGNSARIGNAGSIISTNVSLEKGTPKQPIPSATIDLNGVVTDAHAGNWHRQVSLLALEKIEAFSQSAGRKILPGEFAENITTQGLDLGRVSLLDAFTSGDVHLEVTQIGKECHGTACAIFREVGRCVMPKDGIFCRVVKGGTLTPGDTIVHHPRPFRIRIITMSDRAHAGVYTDRSGPKVKACLEDFFAGTTRPLEIETTVLPDDAELLRDTLRTACAASADMIFTTGGTGIGPRDVTPETIMALADKLIPGIMEHIRLKFGAAKPNALLSRSVAAIIGTTQVYALPGSLNAIDDYMGEILKTLEHAFYMLQGLDTH